MNDLVISERKSSLVSKDDYDHYWRISDIFANSDLVPDHFKKKPQNVFLALQMADRLDIDPMLAIQNIHIIKGRPALSSQMLIAMVNNSGLIDGVIAFESNGKQPPEMAVTASAILKNGQKISATFAFQQAVAMGVTANAPWKTAPELMCRYRAASHLVRSYFPQLSLGLACKEEVEELEPLNVTPRVGQSQVNALLDSRPSAQIEPQQTTQTISQIPTQPAEQKRRGRPAKQQTEIVVEMETDVVPVEIFLEPVLPEPSVDDSLPW